MKIELSRKQLLDSITSSMRFCAKGRMAKLKPVLGMVKLSCRYGDMSIQATDTETSVELLVPIGTDVGCDAGRVVDPKILKALLTGKAARCEISIDDNDGLAVNGIQVDSLPSDEFPPFPSFDDWGHLGTYDGAYLSESFDWLLPACDVESTRFSLGSILIEDGGCLVATDGRRMHVCHPGSIPDSSEASILLPADAAKKLVPTLKKAGRTTLSRYSSYCWRVESEGIRVVGKVVEGRFPQWRQVIPYGSKLCEPIRIPEMSSFLKTAMAMGAGKDAEEPNYSVNLESAGGKLWGVYGSYRAELCDCEYVDVDGFYDPNYLMDMLRSWGDTWLNIYNREVLAMCRECSIAVTMPMDSPKKRKWDREEATA